VEKAIRSAAEWNKTMNADRHEKRRSYFDLQTFIIHKPIKENKVIDVGILLSVLGNPIFF